jgi:hypothetical protein
MADDVFKRCLNPLLRVYYDHSQLLSMHIRDVNDSFLATLVPTLANECQLTLDTEIGHPQSTTPDEAFFNVLTIELRMERVLISRDDWKYPASCHKLCPSSALCRPKAT